MSDGLTNRVTEGLSDEVRADFNVMKDLAVHTRIGPADRIKRLQKFIGDITRYMPLFRDGSYGFFPCEMSYSLSGGAVNSTHSLVQILEKC